MRTQRLTAIVSSAVAFLFPLVATAQIQLITKDEASRPDGQFFNTRAITRGPSIQLASENDVTGAGFLFKVAFEPKGGATIDTKSLRVEYLKDPVIDLTPRLLSHINGNKLEVAQAKVPLGRHALRVTVKDSEGRQTRETLN